MTASLQPMDLVVNSTLKAGLRRERSRRLSGYFTEFKTAFAAQEALAHPVFPVYSPPKPTLAECLHDLRQVFDEDLETRQFKQGLQRAFVTACLARDYAEGPVVPAVPAVASRNAECPQARQHACAVRSLRERRACVSVRRRSRRVHRGRRRAERR